MSKDFERRIAGPWTLKIELSYGCNLNCRFCPTSHLPIGRKDRAYLSMNMCERIVRQAVGIRDDFRVELALRGEPTLNPKCIDIVELIRKLAPKFQLSMFTNGIKFLRDPGMMSGLLDAGINILCIDCYGRTYDRFIGLAKQTGASVVDFDQFTAYKKHKNGHTLRVVNLVPDIQEGSVRTRKIHNNAGNVSIQYLRSLPGYTIKSLPLRKRCVRPFRELVVYLDGRVVICCHDWKAQCVLGDVQGSSLRDTWYGPQHLEVLKKLFSKNRAELTPCRFCDYFGGYRVGLLRDPSK